MSKPLLLIIIIPLMFIVSHVYSQVDTISLPSRDLALKQLQPGLHQYLVYMENPKKHLIFGHSLWNRQINFKTIKGVECIEIVQRWHSADTTRNRYVYSISRKDNFAPIYHYSSSVRGIEAFNFSGNEMKGADSVVSNSKKDFTVKTNTSTLNWELDLEVFNTLPFKQKGQRFIINFYHPGGPEPKYYEYTVTGDEKLSGIENQKIDCWKLRIDYGDNNWGIFWIDKKSKEVLKMQEYFRGMYRYKIRLSNPVAETSH